MQSNTAVQRTSAPLFPFLDLKAHFGLIREDVLAAVTRVIDSQQFILGPEVDAFEREIADYIGVRHAIGCASGSPSRQLNSSVRGLPSLSIITPA